MGGSAGCRGLPDVDAQKAASVLALLDRAPRIGAVFMRDVVLGILLTASAACVTSTPGVTRTSSDNPLVTIGAGGAEIGGGTFWRVWYVIDKRTQTCWMKLGDAGAQLDCCALRRVSEAQPYITWTNCPGEVPSPPPSGVPAAGSAVPAASPDAH
jgi:hypothetical protein